jgi:hypothetical protein
MIPSIMFLKPSLEIPLSERLSIVRIGLCSMSLRNATVPLFPILFQLSPSIFAIENDERD